MAAQNMAGNPLSAGSIASFMATSLPKDASPQLKNPWDAVALAVHAGMIAVGFRLIGLGEDHRIEARSEAHDTQPLPAEWNAPSVYAFRYAHNQSSMEYLLKVNRLGNKAVVFGIGLGDDKTTSFDIMVRDYISESSLPATPLTSDTSLEDASRALQSIFISAGRLNDLTALLKINIIQKLAPGLRKEGYEETAQSSSSRDNANDQTQRRRSPERPQHDPLRDDFQPPPARPHPFADPLADPPRRPHAGDEFLPPGFEDEYEITRPPRGMGPTAGGEPFGRIGERDLYPPGLGPHDPLYPGIGPRPGLGGIGGGGMHPTFDDPLFQGQGEGRGRGERGGYDPQAPPGARYDPVGPGDVPRDQRGGMRFPGGGGRGGFGGGMGNPFGGFGGGDFI